MKLNPLQKYKYLVELKLADGNYVKITTVTHLEFTEVIYAEKVIEALTGKNYMMGRRYWDPITVAFETIPETGQDIYKLLSKQFVNNYKFEAKCSVLNPDDSVYEQFTLNDCFIQELGWEVVPDLNKHDIEMKLMFNNFYGPSEPKLQDIIETPDNAYERAMSIIE